MSSVNKQKWQAGKFWKNSNFTQALAHNFVRIVFKIQTKNFSDILNDQRASSLKQSANSGYFEKPLISYNRALYPRLVPELSSSWNPLYPFPWNFSWKKCQQRIIRKFPIGPSLIQLNMYIYFICLFKSLILIC